MSDPAGFTDRYQGLMPFYDIESEKTQAGHGNENGDVEQRHHRFKRAVSQELMLHGSVDEYRRLLSAMFDRNHLVHLIRKQFTLALAAMLLETPLTSKRLLNSRHRITLNVIQIPRGLKTRAEVPQEASD